jgi:hypothetical protein
VVSDHPGTFVSFVKVNPQGLLACGSFNDDTIRFVDSWTGEVDPFPFFEPVSLLPPGFFDFLGLQDAVYCMRNGQSGLLMISTVKNGFHWLPF